MRLARSKRPVRAVLEATGIYFLDLACELARGRRGVGIVLTDDEQRQVDCRELVLALQRNRLGGTGRHRHATGEHTVGAERKPKIVVIHSDAL
jgi:hypothetical protein